MQVELVNSGAGTTLTPAVALAAYRVVQEGLTNARAHAPGAAVTITSTVDRDVARVVVRNAPPATANGRSQDGGVTEGGHGLIGMQERVLHAGGRVAVGPTTQGGWEIEATFPLTDDREAP